MRDLSWSVCSSKSSQDLPPAQASRLLAHAFNDNFVSINSSTPLFQEDGWVIGFWGVSFMPSCPSGAVAREFVRSARNDRSHAEVFFRRLNGNYSCVVYDTRSQKLLVLSDTLATGAIYWAFNHRPSHANHFQVASDSCDFKAPDFELDPKWLSRYFLNFEFTEGPSNESTAIKGVQRLGRGRVIRIEKKQEAVGFEIVEDFDTHQFLSEAFHNPRALDLNAATDEAEDILTEAMIATAPVSGHAALSFSGGLDSTTLYALGRKLGFDWRLLVVDYDSLFNSVVSPSLCEILRGLPDVRAVENFKGSIDTRPESYFRNFTLKQHEKPFLQNGYVVPLATKVNAGAIYNGYLGDPFFTHRLHYYLAFRAARAFSRRELASIKDQLLAVDSTKLDIRIERRRILAARLEPYLKELLATPNSIMSHHDWMMDDLADFFVKYDGDFVRFILDTSGAVTWSTRDWDDSGIPTISPMCNHKLAAAVFSLPTEILSLSSCDSGLQKEIIKRHLGSNEIQLRPKHAELDRAAIWTLQMPCSPEVWDDFYKAIGLVGSFFEDVEAYKSATNHFYQRKTLAYFELKILGFYYWFENWQRSFAQDQIVLNPMGNAPNLPH